MTNVLTTLLLTAAVLQTILAILNLCLVRLMRWKQELRELPSLLREVFHVHAFFVSLTLAIFALLTWRFSSEMVTGNNPLGVWLAASIGTFWGIRTMIQCAYYSHSHWWGKTGPTLVHAALSFIYAGMTVTYFAAASC